MSRYSSLNLPHANADRARELAHSSGLPVGVYVANLIDAAYAAVMGDPGTEGLAVERDGPSVVAVTLELPDEKGGLRSLAIPAEAVPTVADHIERMATKGGALPDQALPVRLKVSRRGSGVILESGKGRRSYSVTAAQKLAHALRATLRD
jgi:hypothetical protein